MSDFLFAVPSGEPVALEPFHYGIIGQTQFSGKTTLIKRLSEWVVGQGYTVLIFDTKETEADYAGFGKEVPVCLRETTDSFVLIGLLESMFKRRLTPYYATLSRLTEAAKGFGDIIRRAKDLESKTKSAWLRDACRVLYDLLERLQSETSKVETVPQLKLYPGINRMPINDFSLEAQQLIMKNSFEDLLRIYRRKTIGAIDEAFKFLPQGYSSAATRAVMNVITQGAKTELYTWIATQFLAVTDKDPLKACAVKFLGTQDHITEVKHTLDLIPEARGKFSPDDIMKLKLGHWILVRKRPPFVGVVYSLPVNVSEDVGRKVSRGELTPEHVRDHFLKVKVMEVDETVWKEKYEQLEKRFADIRTEIFNELKKEFESKIEGERQKFEKQVKFLEAKSEDLMKRVGEAREDLKLFDEFKSVFRRMFPESVGPRGFEPATSVPSEIAVAIEQPALTIQRRTPPLTLDESSLENRIAIVYAEGRLPDKAFTTGELSNILEARFGSGAFKGYLGPACNKFVAWGYFEKVKAGSRWDYKIKMKPEDAKAKGLLKEVEA